MDLSIAAVENNVADVQVSGAITQAQLSPSQEPLSVALGPNAYNHKILLDLTNSDHIDSSGVNWLLTMHRRARENGGRLVIHSVPPLVDNVLKVLRMNLVFEIAPSREEAFRMIAGDAA
jgi:anti-anti-sigma factor